MIKQLLKKLIPPKAKKALSDKMGVPSQENSFKNIRRLGFNPKFCLDIGAYEGNWTHDFKKTFPECAIMMIEGQVEKEPVLLKAKNSYTDVNYKIALLGATETNVTFNIYETASSVLAERDENNTNAKVETRKLSMLDNIIAPLKQQPDFIKIDTQGYEMEILKGGEKILSGAEFVLLEVSLIDIYINSPLVADVLDFMRQRGFVLYDICSLMRRPLDKALFQSDFLFVRADSKFRTNKRWI
jgi:FkbM family methyltransferase